MAHPHSKLALTCIGRKFSLVRMLLRPCGEACAQVDVMLVDLVWLLDFDLTGVYGLSGQVCALVIWVLLVGPD